MKPKVKQTTEAAEAPLVEAISRAERALAGEGSLELALSILVEEVKQRRAAGATRYAKGERIRFLKGARIWSTAPGWPAEGKTSGREQVITVAFFDPGYHQPAEGRFEARTVPDRVRWAGAGGYWRWVDASQTERLAEAAAE